MTVATGLALIVAPCAERLRRAVILAGHGDAGPVHELRIGVRRLRAALSIFRDVIPRVERRRLRAGLRWLLQITGPLRDIDVLLDSTLREIEGRPAAAGAQAVAAGLAAAHPQAQRQVTGALAGPRCRRLRASLEKFSADCRDAHGLPPEVAAAPMLALASASLRRHHRRLRQPTRAIARLGHRRLHRLRVRLRAQRYRAELLAGLYPRAAVHAYAGALQRLQRQLGRIHDLRVALERIGATVGSSGNRLAQLCTVRLDARRARLRDPRLDHGRLKPFWK